MHVLFLAAHDFAGVISVLYNGINKYTEHKAHMVRWNDHPYGYKTEYRIQDLSLKKMQELWEWADVLHYNIFSRPAIPEGCSLKGKRVIGHCHGFNIRYKQDFREDVKRSLNSGLFSKVLLSTPDLLKFRIPGTDFDKYEYLPNAYPIDDERYSPVKNKRWDILRVANFPYNAQMKNTAAFLKACASLYKSGLRFDTLVLTAISHDSCLRLKSQCHMVFDSIAKKSDDHHFEAISLGVNGVESLTMGIPVMVKLDEEYALPRYLEMTREIGMKELPLVLVDEDTLEGILRYYLTNKEKLKERGEEGRIWVRKTHGNDIIAKRVIKIYEELLVQ